MTPSEAIGTRLTSDTALAALVSDRIAPIKPEHDATLPYVVFTKSSGGDGANLTAARRTRQHDIRVDVYAANETDAEPVLAAVLDRLDCWQDRSIGVQGCFAQGDADQEQMDDGNVISGQTFSLWFSPQ